MDTITLPQSLFTVKDLLALGGLVVAVYVIVSFLKDPLKLLVKRLTGKDNGDWIVRPATVLVALGILVWLMFIQGDVGPETIGLAIINAFLVALIAGAAHDYIVSPTKDKAQKQIISAEQAQLDLMGLQTNNINNNTDAVTAIRAGDRGEEPPGGNSISM
ncbi:hypothetical protein JCM15765_14590 [Paradesulfitobacterium aromaticivorans]